ncbi:RelA/SpoT domain-containing protein [Schaalia odontolytica]|uniref:RelA/SpoT domain-containing protein n=2 Tax=Schaalia odontolytica TaxID=1660 RepID=A0A857A8C1_9ACTO|nr:RelA/SpoT domain-containing protein [Schaalia odontolytica]QGS10725.1 hypothetical protein FOC40_04430 [Schaalia odontolytica]
MSKSQQHVSREAASKAGSRLKASGGRDPEALAIAQAWRVQHLEPTVFCFEALTRCAEHFQGAVVSYRLKRMRSIVRKLQRDNNRFKLGALDDIGGCRLIVGSVREVYEAARILDDLLEHRKIKDYIAAPQRSGYRSYHAIYKVPVGGITYRIEVQIRTRLQHLWATGVEAVGEVYGLEYKSPDVRASLEGDERKRDRFLMLSSHLFASEEGRPGVPDVPDDLAAVRREISTICETTHLLEDLRAARSGILVQADSDERDEYFLLCLSREIQFFDVVGFPEFQAANDEYQRLEKEALRIEDGNDVVIAEPEFDNVVLVKAESADSIKSSYLNYSLGVDGFISRVEQASGLSLS